VKAVNLVKKTKRIRLVRVSKIGGSVMVTFSEAQYIVCGRVDTTLYIVVEYLKRGIVTPELPNYRV